MDDLVQAQFDRVSDEQKRQNVRLEKLEDSISNINQLVLSVQKLSINMESMLKEQLRQGERLQTLEQAPIDTWNGAKQTAINTLVGGVIGALVTGLIVLMNMGV